MQYVPEILLLLFIINLGMVLGAGIYEMRIVLPMWFSKTAEGYSVNVEAINKIDTGRKFWVFVTTIPLTLLTIANLVVAIQSQQPRHDWWLASALIILADRIGTFVFFIPNVIKFQKTDTLQPAKASSLVSLWINMNYIRNLLTLLAFVAALRALTLH